MQRQDVKTTPKRVDFVRDHLHLSDRELSNKTGLTEYEISVIRKVERNPDLQSNQRGIHYTTRQIEEDENKCTIEEIKRETSFSKSKLRRDIKRLDFVEEKHVGKSLYITTEELEKYKEYLDER